jgi:hypothetical protein
MTFGLSKRLGSLRFEVAGKMRRRGKLTQDPAFTYLVSLP